MYLASINGHLEVVKYLIETCEVDKDAKTKAGATPFDLAFENNKSNVLEYMTQGRVNMAETIDSMNKVKIENDDELRKVTTELQSENQKMNQKIEYLMNLLDSKSKNACNGRLAYAGYEKSNEDKSIMDIDMDHEGATSCQLSNHDEGFMIIEEHVEMLPDDDWQQINSLKDERF